MSEIRSLKGPIHSENFIKNINLDLPVVNESPEMTLTQKMNSENLSCRICLCDGYDDEYQNPIIQPCKCIGTMKYVHLACFKSWIKKQVLVKKSTNLMSFYWKKLQCELCQTLIYSKINTLSS